jgi:hypothetical protein
MARTVALDFDVRFRIRRVLLARGTWLAAAIRLHVFFAPDAAQRPAVESVGLRQGTYFSGDMISTGKPRSLTCFYEVPRAATSGLALTAPNGCVSFIAFGVNINAIFPLLQRNKGKVRSVQSKASAVLLIQKLDDGRAQRQLETRRRNVRINDGQAGLGRDFDQLRTDAQLGKRVLVCPQVVARTD